MELQVWRGPAQNEPGAGTFRSYIGQIVQHALSPHPQIFVQALQEFIEALPPISMTAVKKFFPEAPTSISDPVAIVARHYLSLLEEGAADPNRCISVSNLTQLLDGFGRLVGPPLERSEPLTAVQAFLALAALCDLRHQRRLISESLTNLPVLDLRAPDGEEAKFWAGCFFSLLEFSQMLPESETDEQERMHTT